MTVTGYDFTGRKVVITGGGSGTGACMARHFAAYGAHVIIAGRRKSALEAVAEGCGTIYPYVCDVTQETALSALFDFAEGKGVPQPAADIVIANAGIAASAPLDKTERDLWDQIIAVNLTGPFLTLREGLARIKAAQCQQAAYCDCINDGQASLSIYFGLCCQQTWGSGAGEVSSLRSRSSRHWRL